MRRLVVFVVAVLMLSVASLAIADPPERSNPGTKVICINGYEPPTGNYLYKPRKCVLHHRGSFPIANASLLDLSAMHWKRWQSGSAVGKGKTVVNVVGRGDITVKLFKARNRCGTPVFTKVKFNSKFRYQGETYRDHGKMSIDSCLS